MFLVAMADPRLTLLYLLGGEVDDQYYKFVC